MPTRSRRFRSMLAALPLAAISCTAPSKSSSGDAAAEVRDAYERLLVAIREENAERFGALLTDDYTCGAVDGTMKSKSQRVHDLVTEDNEIQVLDVESFESRPVGDTRVAVARVHDVGVWQGAPYDRRLLVTTTFVRQGGKWLVAAAHMSTVAPPAAPTAAAVPARN